MDSEFCVQGNCYSPKAGKKGRHPSICQLSEKIAAGKRVFWKTGWESEWPRWNTVGAIVRDCQSGSYCLSGPLWLSSLGPGSLNSPLDGQDPVSWLHSVAMHSQGSWTTYPAGGKCSPEAGRPSRGLSPWAGVSCQATWPAADDTEKKNATQTGLEIRKLWPHLLIIG